MTRRARTRGVLVTGDFHYRTLAKALALVERARKRHRGQARALAAAKAATTRLLKREVRHARGI